MTARWRGLLPFLSILVLGYLAVCALLFVFQARLIWFPGPPPEAQPADYGLAFQELDLVAADGVRVHGWFLPAPDARATVVFCHGNAGNIAHRIPHAQALLEAGAAVLLFDYRGYGRSEGSPTEEGTYLDALAAYDHLVASGTEPERIVAWGESLGAGAALELARRRAVAAVVIESAFTSLPDMGAEVYGWLPVRLLSRYRYANLEKVGQLGVPLLVIHSPADEIVPFAHGRRLFDAAREPKRLLETEGGHNDGGFLRRAQWRREVARFLADVVPRPAEPSRPAPVEGGG